MRKVIDFDATVQKFFDDAISWLECRPIRMCNGKYNEGIACDYLKVVQKDPRKNTMNNAVYVNCDKLTGFIERHIDRNGNLVINNDLYLAVIRVLDAIGQCYTDDYQYAQQELLKNIKQFQIALNRNKIIKSAFYKMQPLTYFAQKQR